MFCYGNIVNDAENLSAQLLKYNIGTGTDVRHKICESLKICKPPRLQ
jgi:hypothetical protein